MATPIRQSHFGGGEIDPEEQGHSQSVMVQRGLATCRNAFSTKRGSWVNRPGTVFVAATKDNTASRLLPFIFSDDQTFVLEVGALYIRFFTGGAPVTVLGVPYELVTPWIQPDLERLKFVQVGDVITVTHPSYAPREINRLSNTSWTLTLAAFTPPVPAFLAGQASNGTFGQGIAPVDDATHPLKDWRWKASVLIRRPDGSVFETQAVDATALPYDAANPYSVNDLASEGGVVYRSLAGANLGNLPSASAASWTKDGSWGKSCPGPEKPMWFALNSSIDQDANVGDPSTPVLGTSIGLRWYRGRGSASDSIYGWLGDQMSLAVPLAFFRDDGQEPDFSIQPKLGTNPFNASDKYPAVVANFDQRRIFARTNLQPATFWGSALGDFADFDNPFPVSEDDSFNFKLAQKQLEEIRSVLGHEKLMLFTGAGVWPASGSQGDAISALSINVRKSTGNPGASWLDPIAVQTRLLYQTARGNRVHDLVFEFRTQSYLGDDVTVHARHLLEGYDIVDWCYQEHPYSIVWAVRNDGALLSLTYDTTQTPPVLAWALHTTADAADFFEHCCCVPQNPTEDTSSSPDAVYLIVRRGGGNLRYIERLADRSQFTTTGSVAPDVRNSVFLDGAEVFAFLNTGTVTMTASGASYAAGDEVTVTAAAPTFGNAPGTDSFGSDVVFGVSAADAPEIRVRITQWISDTVVKGILQKALPAVYQNAATSDWGFAYAKFPVTAAPLIGREIWALADGAVQGPFTTSGPNNRITFNPPALYITLGIRYDSDGELLELPGESAKGSVKAVKSVQLSVVASRGLKVGADFDHLSTPQLRKVSDGFGVAPLLTQKVSVTPKGGWTSEGRVCWRQAEPLPLTVTSVVRRVVYGGDDE